MEYWSGVESYFGGTNNLIPFRHRVFYGVESLSRVLERSIGVEWSQILEWQK